MMGQIRRMGFNTIRLPFSLQALDSAPRSRARLLERARTRR